MNSEINYVSPFKKFCISIGNLPTSYLESMSYYESLTYLVNYLSNNVIPALNNNGEVVEELQAQFTILKNYVDTYFDNLDVQEEINNKLDEMAESGQLTDIIAQYLGLAGIIAFDTVADMKLANNLVNGSKVKTMGYYSINDGGGALYSITNTQDSTLYQEEVNNNLYATLIGEYVSPEMLGAKGDGITDDGDKLIYLKQFSNILFGKDKTYLSSKNIEINSPSYINLNGSTIKMYDRLSDETGNILNLTGDNIIVENGNIEGDLDDRTTYSENIDGIRISGNNIEIKNLNITKCCTDGIITIGNNITLHDLDVGNCGRNNISVLYGKNVKMYNLFVHDNEHAMNPGHGIDIEPYADEQDVENLEIYNITTKNNYGSGINLSFYNDTNVQANVHDIICNDVFSVKLNNNPTGNLYIENVKIDEKSFQIHDPCSQTFNTYINNITILNHTPSVTSSYWGSAFLIRSGVSYTGNIYNLHISNVKILNGTSTYGIYLSGVRDYTVNNSEINNVYCNRNDIRVFIGNNVNGLILNNLNSPYKYELTGSILSSYYFSPEINVNSTNNSITIATGFIYKDYIKINNLKNNYLAITSQSNNNYGLTIFRLPPYRSCLLKVNEDGTCEVISDRITQLVTANSNVDIKLNNVNNITLQNNTHLEVYKIINDVATQTFQNTATGGSITISNGIATVTNSTSSNLYVHLDY